MKKILLILFILLLCIFIILTINKIRNKEVELENKEGESIMTSNLKVLIDGKEYNLKLEENELSKYFLTILPLELNMNELNGNEKYAYLDATFDAENYVPERIEAGDVMLYGDNCLVIFYKSFNTSYSYAKLGHIDNLPDLGNKNIVVKIEK